ncbi:MAG TPA: L,D-transpeptidase [Anaerolineales bacterium]|nr:L,D-transpeptidase [Anaerolineales bacterium]
MSRLRPELSRRDFLKLSGATFGASMLPRFSVVGGVPSPSDRLCRVTELETAIRSRPNPESSEVTVAHLDDVLVVGREVVGRGVFPHNHIWFETPQGFVWSSDAQPVRNAPNPLESRIAAEGIWTEITVPFVDGRRLPDPAAPIRYRLYYSMVLNVNEVVVDSDGAAWYRVEDENAVVMYAPGEAFRRITPQEITPLGQPDAPKVIRVNLDRQDLSAMEGGVEVYYCRISSGYSFTKEGERVWNTPIGQNWTWRKMISRHMSGGDLVSGYDLPGVGWTILFSGTGAAVHSTYWHNDFGTPRSRGCINVLPEDAKWLFRWSNPPVAYKPGDVTSLFPNPGTPVAVQEF